MLEQFMNAKKRVAIIVVFGLISVIIGGGYLFYEDGVILLPIGTSINKGVTNVEEVYKDFNTEDPYQVIEAIYRLHPLDNEKVHDVLLELWRDGKIVERFSNQEILKDPRIKTIVAAKLIEAEGIEKNSEEYENYIHEKAIDGNEEIRAMSAIAMASIGGVKEVLLLSNMVQKDTRLVAANAVLSLKKIYLSNRPGMKDSKEELYRLANITFENPLINHELKKAIVEIQQKDDLHSP
jgi:hypothetical protein